MKLATHRKWSMAAIAGTAFLATSSYAGTISSIDISALGTSGTLGSDSIFSGSHDLQSGAFSLNTLFDIGDINYAEIENWQVSITGSDFGTLSSGASITGAYNLPVTMNITGIGEISLNLAQALIDSGNGNSATYTFAADSLNDGDTAALIGIDTSISDMSISLNISEAPTTPVPVPAAVWLLGSGLLGLVGAKRINSKKQAA